MVERTYYSPESLNKAMELVKELKNIMVKAQDFKLAGTMRDAERALLLKKDSDDNRRI